MATENELQIILTLVDDASAKLKTALGETEKKTEETTKKAETNWARVSVSVMGVYKALKFARDGMADIIKIGKEIDPTFKKSFDNFDTAVLKVKASIAEKLIPMLEVALDFWTKFLNSKTEGTGASAYNEQLKESERNLNILIQREGELKRSIADKFMNSFLYA
jgi:hypothetical protein